MKHETPQFQAPQQQQVTGWQVMGYGPLTKAQVDLVNEIYVKGAELSELVKKLRSAKDLDQQWTATGAMYVQIGLMMLTRGVTQPTHF